MPKLRAEMRNAMKFEANGSEISIKRSFVEQNFVNFVLSAGKNQRGNMFVTQKPIKSVCP
jgi:hypothetical protein